MAKKIKAEQVLELLVKFYSTAPQPPVITFKEVESDIVMHPHPIGIEMTVSDCDESVIGLMLVNPYRKLNKEGRGVLKKGSMELALKLIHALDRKVREKLCASRNN